MHLKSKKGFSTMEILISLALLIGLAVVLYALLFKGKGGADEVIKVIECDGFGLFGGECVATKEECAAKEGTPVKGIIKCTGKTPWCCFGMSEGEGVASGTMYACIYEEEPWEPVYETNCWSSEAECNERVTGWQGHPDNGMPSEAKTWCDGMGFDCECKNIDEFIEARNSRCEDETTKRWTVFFLDPSEEKRAGIKDCYDTTQECEEKKQAGECALCLPNYDANECPEPSTPTISGSSH